MPQSRKTQISLRDTHYYHCISRCVRRISLCGIDKHSGRSYEHRKQWVEDRLHCLADIFAIDVCAYAVMSNHTHTVLHVNEKQASSWSNIEVLNRWHKLYKGTLLTQQFIDQYPTPLMTSDELKTVIRTIKIYRQRLYDISWFMRSLNEYIARAANKEENCTGRFWEGRFKCQALLTESALLACMVYVDLNPVRAKVAATPESSAHTSIFHRAESAKHQTQPRFLMEFNGAIKLESYAALNFTVEDYLILVDETGKAMRRDKPGQIDSRLPPILERLSISPPNWLVLASNLEKKFFHAIGSEKALRTFKLNTKCKRMSGISSARILLNSA